MQLAWHFPCSFLLLSLPDFHPKTLHQDHDILDGITLCTRMCTRIKQANPACLHTLNRSLFRFNSSNLCRFHLCRIYFLKSTGLTCSTWEQAFCLLPHGRTAHAEACKVSEDQKAKQWGTIQVSLLVPPGEEEDLPVHLPNLTSKWHFKWYLVYCKDALKKDAWTFWKKSQVPQPKIFAKFNTYF